MRRPLTSRSSPRILAAIAAALVTTIAVGVGAQKIQERKPVEPPAQIPQQTGCTRWEGRVEGNDKVLARMRLCVQDQRVTGLFQWSSPRSGWNERELDGTAVDGDERMTLRDVRFVSNRVNPGWRFCLVDRYDLVRDGDRLTGTYESKACRDRATLDLQRVPDDAPPHRDEPAASAAPPPAALPPAAPSAAPPAPSPSRVSCACRLASAPLGGGAPGVAGLVAAVATVVARRRGRDRGRRLG